MTSGGEKQGSGKRALRPEANMAAVARSSSISGTPPAARVQVLIVDDDDDQRHLLRIHFENAGCAVTLADSAESAITAYQGEDIDLAVTELLLPGMDGWTLSERIGVDRPGCQIAICSVLDREEYPPACVPLPKPVTRASIRRVLRKYVPRWVSP